MVHKISFAAVVAQNQSNVNNNINASNPIPKIGQIDAFHPFYLYPSDHPGLLLVNQSLSEKNYSQWSRAMTIALTAKFKIGFIDGTYSKPDPNSPLLPYWERCNSMVISWLLNAVSSEISSSIVYLSTAKQIWDDLSTRFTQSHIPRVYQVRKDLVSLTQGNQNLSVYYTKFRALLDELDNLTLIPKCTCDCVCGNDILQAKNENVTKVSQFLMGLNPQFAAVRSQILMMSTLPSLNEAYSLLLQEEEQKRWALLHTENIKDSAALLVKKFGTSKPKSKLTCDYCKDTGHTREKCFALNGYPPRFKGPRVYSSAGADKNFSHKLSNDKQNSSGHLKGKYVPQAAQVSYAQPFQFSSVNTGSQSVGEGSFSGVSSLSSSGSGSYSAGSGSYSPHISPAQYSQTMDILNTSPSSSQNYQTHGYITTQASNSQFLSQNYQTQGYITPQASNSHVAAMSNTLPTAHLSEESRGTTLVERVLDGKVKPKAAENQETEIQLEVDIQGSSVPGEKNTVKNQDQREHLSSNVEVTKINVSATVVDKVDNWSKVSHPSLEIVPIAFARRKLLILDINGLLADVVFPPPKECKGDIHILGRAIIKRPFYFEFLKFCFDRFDVGIWSSRSKKIVDQVVDYLLGDMKHKLLFCWDLSHCTETGFYTLENRHKPLVCKDLWKIWGKYDTNLPWAKGHYDESNTMLLDDSPYKSLFNPIHSAVFPSSFTYKDKNDTSLGPEGDLRLYVENLAKAKNMKKYVERHPFGQSRIDEKSSCWDFYYKVLRTLSTVSTTNSYLGL